MIKGLFSSLSLVFFVQSVCVLFFVMFVLRNYAITIAITLKHASSYSKYSDVLSHLFGVAHSRKTAKSRRIVDNVCAAVCRMIVAQQDAVPLDKVTHTPSLSHHLIRIVW